MGKVLILFLPVFLSYSVLYAAPKKITIIHTNDMHSHVLGFSPIIDYNPDITGSDKTLGGWARLKTFINNTKNAKTNPVLVLDAGDFLMGSLFHTVSREYAFELKLLKEMGYDAVGLGNHEFDLTPDGLARIINSGAKNGMPQILSSNMIFTRDSREDRTLKEVYDNGLIKPYIVLNRDGLKIGIFSVMGKEAAEVAPFAYPVTFSDPVAAAKKMTDILRNSEKADVVICLSHSGINADKSKSEDEILAKEVRGIDVIISGHTHTRLDRALEVNGVIIVSAWAFGKQAGVLDISVDSGKVSLAGYKTVKMDSSIKGDPVLSAEIGNMEGGIDVLFLKYHNISFNSTVAETKYDLIIDEYETNLGNLVADSLRWSVNSIDYNPDDPSSKVVASFESRGPIRDALLAGKTGRIAMCDLFSAFPLGIGFEESERSIGYPVVTFYLYASELKKGLEVMTSVHPLKGEDYFMQISGIKCRYNPNRMIFDRITEMQIGSEEEGYTPLDYSSSNKKLYRVAANIYNATFMKIVGKFTFGFLEIIPKDKNGKTIEKLVDYRVDVDKTTPGIQELKEWVGLLDYMRSFPDTNGNGIPDIPEKYKGPLGRIVSEASWNPVKLLSGGNYITWGGFSFFLVLSAGLTFLIRAGVRKVKMIKKRM